ncbi:MAG: hypothetical protein E7474_02725 [Ruminococcaceae bacterium]|nr:hypothetical protein [Oscillospiraceae bacterium]
MKSVRKQGLAALVLCLCLLTGCGGAPAQETPQTPEPSAQTEPVQTPQTPAETSPAQTPDGAAGTQGNTSAVADASQMTTVEDVVREGMTPVGGDELFDGVYDVAVDCSSSMFKIEHCELTVANGAMTAALTMSSDAYGYLYAGTAAAAATADVSAYIEPEGRTFVLPVDALDAGVACAAWSRNKELWYDRTLVFRVDSLPLSAFRTVVTADTLGLADGTYTADVTLSGGSGRASVASPCTLWVADGKVTARLVWSSSNYDYMLVDGTRYDADYDDGNSGFVIPVAAFDRPLAVTADTTAMSQPYEIDYTINIDSKSINAAENEN